MPPALTPLDDLTARVADAIRAAFAVDADPVVTPATNREFGDYQSNASMRIAALLKKERGGMMNPRHVAQRIIDHVDGGQLLAKAPEVAGPGFINFTLSSTYVAARCTAALRDERLGLPRVAEPQTVVVEYSSPNIAKQMHVGHIRSTILGDAIARVLNFIGHNVIRQNHVGDWGTQFGMLIARLHEAGGAATARIGDLENFYRQAKARFDDDDSFKIEARETVVRLQRGDTIERNAWQQFVDETRNDYLPIYARLSVNLDVTDERGESFYNDRLAPLTVDLLTAGVAEESEGAVVSFASGHKTPLMIRKSDGGFCYGTTDLAAVEFRAKELHADRVIYLVDARQSQHFQQVFATAKLAAEKIESWKLVARMSLEHASFGSVLGPGGTPLKTREGGTVKLSDLLDEAEVRARKIVDEASPDLPESEKTALAKAVGIGAVKYADLSKDRNSDYVFSFDEMLRLDGNSGPYMQYAHARVKSVLRKAGEQGLPASTRVSILAEPAELALAKQLTTFADTIQIVARDLKPHVLCAYLYDLAKAFSRFWENCPIVKSEGETQVSRLALADLTGRTLTLGLDLLGIEHPDRM